MQREGILRGVRLEDVSIPRRGQRFAFVMDTAPCEGAEALADGADLLVAASTFSDEDAALAAQFAHLTAGQAGSLATTGGVDTLVLTHFSSRYRGHRPACRAGQGTRRRRDEVIAANDLDRISFPKRRSSS